jgi:hypothetical protein
MNEYILKFLKMFDLEIMGWKPFILVEHYPSLQSSQFYMTFGRLHGPVHVSFHGDNVTMLSSMTPVVVSYRKGWNSYDTSLVVKTEPRSANFKMDDIKEILAWDLATQMSRTWRRVGLFYGKETVKELVALIAERAAATGGDDQTTWKALYKMYEAAVPKMGMLTPDFCIEEKEVAGA